MKILVWQWGRFGGGPRVAVELATGLAAQPGIETILSLAKDAEIRATHPGDWAVKTYRGRLGFAWRLVMPWPLLVRIIWHLARHRPDFAICAMPGLLDLVMAAALKLRRIPYAVVVHDARPHPGDRFPWQFGLHWLLLRGASTIITLNRQTENQLRHWRMVAHRHVITIPHPPFDPSVPPSAPHDGPYRVLFAGRLLHYKGLDILADALDLLGPRPDMELRIIGHGPPSATLDRLASLPNVTVENRWLPDAEFDALIGRADAVLLPYREASQSGIAAAALSAGRRVLGTLVGGLPEQLAHDPAAELCGPNPHAFAQGLRDLLERRRFVPLPPRPDPQQAWQSAMTRLSAAITAERQNANNRDR